MSPSTFEPARDLDRALDALALALDAASRAALGHFRGPLRVRVETKPDRSPVTAADRDAEAAIVEQALRAFPGASVLAEEGGATPGDPELRWIVDPLDGTRGFARGGWCWGPIVALEHRGEIVAGGVALPVLGERYVAARGRGCFAKDGARVSVSAVGRWSSATLSLGEIRLLRAGPWAAGVDALVAAADTVRAYGDVGAAVMALTGRAEAWLEAGVKVWDIAAMKVLFEEAGGRFTDLAGAPTVATGSAVGTNGVLHEHVLTTLHGSG